MTTKAELTVLGTKYGWHVRPLTAQEVEGSMTSNELAWHEVFNSANLDAALNPPPPKAPPTEAEVRSEKAKAMAAEYESWCQAHGTQSNALSFEEWQEGKDLESQVQVVKGEVQFWLDKHSTDYIHSDSNRDALNKYITERLDGKITFANLETAFLGLVASGEISVNPPDNSRKPGYWQNAEWHPVEGQAKPFHYGMTDPSKAASGEKAVSKRVVNQSADEFLRNLIESPSFHKKMDESLP
jgi:hypothetical protein